MYKPPHLAVLPFKTSCWIAAESSFHAVDLGCSQDETEHLALGYEGGLKEEPREGQLRAFDVFSWRTLRGDLIELFSSLLRGGGEAALISALCDPREWLELGQVKVSLDIRVIPEAAGH